MFVRMLLILSFIGFSNAYSSENRTFNLTFEGFDNLYIGAGFNIKKFHTKLRLGCDYKMKKYQDFFTTHQLKPSAGVNFGLIKIPKENIELIPSIGFNVISHFDWISGGDVGYSYRLGPNANLAFYKLFKSFIIGGSLDVLFLTFERTENESWNTLFDVSFKPHFIIGYRF